MQFSKVEFSGYNKDGIVTVSTDDAALDDFLSKLKQDYDSALFHPSKVDDGDYALFRQSLSFSAPNGTGLSNGDTVNIIASCDEEIAKKLKINIESSSGSVTVEGLQDVTKLSADEVFADLNVSFSGISPNIEVALENTSRHPFISKMTFMIVDPKERYSNGDTITISATGSDELSIDTGFVLDSPDGQLAKEYTAGSDSEYVSKASDLPKDLIRKAVEAGKGAFTDANEYGVRIFCEANLVPVYINKKATFTYGTPSFVSAYFKTVFPEKVGQLGLSYNDLDIIYEVSISQADGKSCRAYAAVRFSDIIKNSDGSFTYDFSSPEILSESYLSARVKKNVVDSYLSTHEIESVSP